MSYATSLERFLLFKHSAKSKSKASSGDNSSTDAKPTTILLSIVEFKLKFAKRISSTKKRCYHSEICKF